MGIEDVASELYELAPEDFTAARNARVKGAKGAGERELAEALQSLRRPTAGAWLLNQLVRRDRAEVERVLELGARLRAAQGTLGAADLRALDEQRRQLTRAVTQRAVGIGRDAERKVSAQVIADVEDTLRSAMVDADAGAALASGLLTDTFSSTGLEPVDLSRVVALTGVAVGRDGSAEAPEPAEGDAAAKGRADEAIATAEKAVEVAEEALRVVHEEWEERRRRAVEARRRREDLQSDLDEVSRRVEDLRERVVAATAAEEVARAAQVCAARGERSAIESAGRARRELDVLLGHTGG